MRRAPATLSIGRPEPPAPWQQPRSLTDDEVYALTAFILAKNKLIGETDTMDPETLPKVQMPNHGGFIIRFPDRI